MQNNTNIVQEILHDLFSSMEALETQNTAILQFLKDKGIATDEELASHLEQAGNASSVRWRGVRVRADYLFASTIKAAEQAAEKESPKPAENKQEAKAATKQSDEKETAKGRQQVATTNKPANDQPESEPAQNDKSKADQVGAESEQKVEQKVKQNAEQTTEQGVAQDRNQSDDADNNSNNKLRKNDTEKAA
jgi:hypothetical protein